MPGAEAVAVGKAGAVIHDHAVGADAGVAVDPAQHLGGARPVGVGGAELPAQVSAEHVRHRVVAHLEQGDAGDVEP